MGVIAKYTCKNCNFVADDVYIGPGLIIYQAPFLCLDCMNVVSNPIDEQTEIILEQYSHCTKCGSSNLVAWDHKCPKCGSTAVDEEAVGMWD